MGCAGGKPSVEASMQEATANPQQGLRVLKDALEQGANAGQEDAKNIVPQVFELLPKAIGGLKVTDRKAVVSAGAVIELCVKLVNDPSVGDHSPRIDPENVKECINHLSSLLKQVQIQSYKSYASDCANDPDSSAVARAIARAVKALLKLEDQAATCRQEVAKGGLRVAVSCMKTHSGLTPTAKTALLTMFAALLEEPKSAQDLIDNQGIYVLLPYCLEPSMCGASKEFQLLCTELLENCIKNGHRIKNKAEVEAAIEKAKSRSYWDPQCRAELRLSNL
jgi:hypothetical protein